ncbi:hypothetical protein [Aquimarina sp. MMG016]|uniref:hypothetical protein n=1 Tax=Aquimarina sp. MMG016 TaxID=2822690 RepID=UPI001B39E5AB|nr:hypothetical protein [Aquimarina sp. MMG016]MBQ4819622.1 hypothetical protein [Aquimarina sp. MMG016]
MKKYIVLIFLGLLLSSCSRTGLSIIKQDYLTKEYSLHKEKFVPEVLSYEVSEFDIYVYNICEKTNDTIDYTERFCNCPQDFYDKTNNPNMKKVEEVYILNHQNSDLVLYFTTFSHKYIKEGEGFLNDPKHYKDRIVLDQVEYVYIGRLNAIEHWIHFPSAKNEEDIILHFDPDSLPNELCFIEANISTSENRYNNYKPIPLGGVFKDALEYRLSPKYAIDFYKNPNKIRDSKITAKNIQTINIISRKGATEIVFIPEDPTERLYKMASKRIRYKPNFSIIER